MTVTLSQKAGHPAPAAAATEVQLDLVSNEVDAGWNFTGLGADGFDSGPPAERRNSCSGVGTL